MQDVSPELLNRIRSDFKEACRADKELGKTIDKIDGGKGTYREAQEFASNIGDKLGEAYKKNLTPESLPDGRLYRNIAEKVIRPTLHENYELVSDASQKVQKALNDEAGIGLKVQIPEEDTDRVDGIIDRVSDHVDEFTSETADDLASMTENFTHHVVDAFIEKNADFQYNAGLKPKIERDAMAECCGWCLDLAGTYEYPLKDRSVFQRHKDCRCVVDYHPGNGKVQNAHTKQWRDETDSDILEARKTANLEPLVDPAKVEQRKQAENLNAEQKFRMLIQDVTDEYLNKAKPNSGSVKYEDGFEKRLYPNEIRVAEWIHKTFGGDVLLLTEGYVERPDYNWNDKLWDLKFPEKEKSIGKRVQKGLSQIYDNPGGIIIDTQKLDISTERLEQIITGRMKTSLKHQADVIIIEGDKLIKIIRYNKN